MLGVPAEGSSATARVEAALNAAESALPLSDLYLSSNPEAKASNLTLHSSPWQSNASQPHSLVLSLSLPLVIIIER